MNLEEINPFNELYYKNCLYNSLFSVIQFYGYQINPLFSYDLFYYDVVIQDNKLDNIISILEIKKPEDIVIEDIGLQFNKVIKADNIISHINGAIKKNMPSIVWLDSFYLPYRKDTYKRMHLPHTLLIYGAFPDMQYYKIIDHDKFETLTYTKRSLSADALNTAYEGYKNHFPSLNLDTFYEIWANEAKDILTSAYHDVYISNYKRNADIVYNRIKSVKKLEEYLIEIYSNETVLQLQAANILLKLNFAMELKRAEKFVQQRFDFSDEVLESLDMILAHLKHGRDILAKYYYSGKYNKEDLLGSIHLMKVRELEKYRLEAIVKNHTS